MNIFEKQMDAMLGHCRTLDCEHLIMGDLNSKAVEWRSPQPDQRGDYAMEQIITGNLVVINRGNIYTFSRGNSESYIDVTIGYSESCREK